MFSTTTEYALRALAILAQLPENEAILGRDLAKQADIPANYLSKLLWTLGGAGVIEATRGSKGGYRMYRNPKEVFLAEIVELFDKGRANPHCLLAGRELCSDENPCSAHHAWRDARAAYVAFLQTTTITDIARPAESVDVEAGDAE